MLSEKPEIADDTYQLSPQLLEILMAQIGSLASIYHKPSEAFVVRSVTTADEEDEEEECEEDPLDMYGDVGSGSAPGSSAGGGDLLDLMDASPAPAGDILADLGMGQRSGGASAAPSNLPQLCTAEEGQGIAVAGVMMAGADGHPALQLTFTNASPTAVSALAIQLNKNCLGLAPQSPQISLSGQIVNGSSASTIVALKTAPQSMNPSDTTSSIKVNPNPNPNLNPNANPNPNSNPNPYSD